jgi:hypothetical protein
MEVPTFSFGMSPMFSLGAQNKDLSDVMDVESRPSFAFWQKLVASNNHQFKTMERSTLDK